MRLQKVGIFSIWVQNWLYWNPRLPEQTHPNCNTAVLQRCVQVVQSTHSCCWLLCIVTFCKSNVFCRAQMCALAFSVSDTKVLKCYCKAVLVKGENNTCVCILDNITKEQSYAMQKWESACCQTIAMQKRREKVKWFKISHSICSLPAIVPLGPSLYLFIHFHPSLPPVLLFSQHAVHLCLTAFLTTEKQHLAYLKAHQAFNHTDFEFFFFPFN